MPKLLNHSIGKPARGFLIVEDVASSGSCTSTSSILPGPVRICSAGCVDELSALRLSLLFLAPLAGGTDPGAAFLRCCWVLREGAVSHHLSSHTVPANPPCVVMGTVAVLVQTGQLVPLNKKGPD